MAGSSDTIDHATVQRLVEAGTVDGAEVVGQPGGWGIIIKYGMAERALAARRGSIRIFSRFETLVSYLKSIGIYQFNVDATSYNPADKRTRPDSSVRMKRAFDAAEHDRWFREQVEEGLRQADSPDAAWVPHEDVVEAMQRQREALMESLAGKIPGNQGCVPSKD